MKTLLLKRSDIEGLLDPEALLPALRDAFAAYSTGRSISVRRIPVPLSDPAPENANAMILMPGLIPEIPAYTVKVHDLNSPGCCRRSRAPCFSMT